MKQLLKKFKPHISWTAECLPKSIQISLIEAYLDFLYFCPYCPLPPSTPHGSGFVWLASGSCLPLLLGLPGVPTNYLQWANTVGGWSIYMCKYKYKYRTLRKILLLMIFPDAYLWKCSKSNETMVASKFENRDNAKGFLVAFLKPFLVPPFMSLRQQ